MPNQGREGSLRTGDAGQFQERGGDGEGQAFVFHPLLAQDDADAESGQEDRPQEASPPHQRGYPGLVGDGYLVRQALVESACRLAVRHDAPGGDVLEEDLFPAVLRCGKVGRGGDDAEEVSGEPLSLHEGCDHAHTGDGQEFGRQ